MRSLVYSLSSSALIAGSILLATEAGAQRKPSAAVPARPNAARGAIEIQTVPPGLAIYVGVDTSTTRPDSGWVPIVTPHPMLIPAQRRGTAPLTLRDIKPGHYLLGVSELPLLDRDLQPAGYADPFLEVAAVAPSRPLTNVMPGRRLDAPVVGALVYRLTVTDSGPRRVVILSRPDLTLAALDSLYPRTTAFEFDTVAFAAEWERKTANSLSPTENRAVIGLLRRGGKCVVEKNHTRFAAEVLPDHTWKIAIAIRLAPGANRP